MKKLSLLIFVAGLAGRLCAAPFYQYPQTNTVNPFDLLLLGTPDSHGGYVLHTVIASNLPAGSMTSSNVVFSTNAIHLPLVSVSASGLINGASNLNAGYDFGPDTPGTKTFGIQEAINSLLPTNDYPSGRFGGTILIQPGYYFLTETAHTPTNAANQTPLCAAQLNIIGLSEQSTILAYSNSTCGTVLQIGAGRSGSFNYTLPLNCYIHGLTFSSVIEGQTNLVYVDGNGGGVSEVTVDSCWFEAWPYLTNYSAASGDLIPIRMEVNLGGPEIITHCFFSYVNAVYWAVDHGVIADNTFNYIGAYSTWAANTPFAWHSGGCGIVVGDPTGPNHYANGNEEWHFDRNFFDNCNGIFDTGSGNMSLAKNPVLNECAWESSQTPVSVFTVTNNPRTWTLVDPILDCPSLTNYMTTASYSLMGPATTNVYVVDLRGPTVSAKSFAGDGSQLTGLNGANMTPGTITTQAVNSAFLALLGNGGAPGNYVVTNSPIITVFTNMTTVGWQPATGAGNSYVQNFASNVTAHIQLRYNAGASAGTTKLDVSIPATTNFCGLSNSWIAGFPSTLGVVDYDVGLDLPLPYGVTVTFKDSSTGGGNSVNFTSCLLEKTSSLWPAVAVTASAPTNISYSSITNPPPKQVFHFVCHLDNPIFTAATNYSALNSTAFSLFPAYYNSPWFMGGIITNVTALAYNIAGIGSGTNLTCGVATNKITDNAMTATINGAGGSNITYYASSGTNSDPVAAGVTNLIFFLNASTNWTGTSARIDVAFDLIWPGISTP